MIRGQIFVLPNRAIFDELRDRHYMINEVTDRLIIKLIRRLKEKLEWRGTALLMEEVLEQSKAKHD